MTGIRAATTSDVPAMAQLHAQSFDEAWSEKALRDLLAVPGTAALLELQGAGFLLFRTAADESEILTICVSPACRRSGVGSALLRAASTTALERGANAMFLEVAADNAAGRALYKRHGFGTVGTRKAYYGGTDALILRAPIPLPETMGNAKKTF